MILSLFIFYLLSIEQSQSVECNRMQILIFAFKLKLTENFIILKILQAAIALFFHQFAQRIVVVTHHVRQPI